MHLLFAFFASETIKWLNYNSLGLMLLLCFVLLLSRLICAHVLVYPLSSISIKYLMNVRHLVWTGNSLFAMSGHSPVVLCSVGLIEKNHNQFMVRYCVFSVLFLYNQWVTFGSVGRSEQNYNNEIRMGIHSSVKKKSIWKNYTNISL